MYLLKFTNPNTNIKKFTNLSLCSFVLTKNNMFKYILKKHLGKNYNCLLINSVNNKVKLSRK